jgi:hypothetical protein
VEWEYFSSFFSFNESNSPFFESDTEQLVEEDSIFKI